MIIREMTEEDLPQVIDLYKQLDSKNENIDLEKSKMIFKKSNKTQIIKYMVAEIDGKIVSSCYLVVIPNITNNCKSIGFIENVITDKNHRGNGIGRKIISQVIELAKKEQCYKVILQSAMKRTQAHKFYEKIGFDGNSKKAFDFRIE